MQAHHVRARPAARSSCSGRTPCSRHSGRSAVDRRVEGDHVHAQRPRARRRELADAAEADQPSVLPASSRPFEAPPAATAPLRRQRSPAMRHAAASSRSRSHARPPPAHWRRWPETPSMPRASQAGTSMLSSRRRACPPPAAAAPAPASAASTRVRLRTISPSRIGKRRHQRLPPVDQVRLVAHVELPPQRLDSRLVHELGNDDPHVLPRTLVPGPLRACT